MPYCLRPPGWLEIPTRPKLLETVTDVSVDVLRILEQYPNIIACLSCGKCRLWGTIQAKGIVAAVKVLCGISLFDTDVICLINLFRQLTITMEESRRMEDYLWPHENVLIANSMDSMKFIRYRDSNSN